MSHAENDRYHEQRREAEGEIMHTPTPWEVITRDHNTTFELHEKNPRGLHSLIAEVPTMYDGKNNTDKAIEAKANAAFIVTACNAHEDLVKACENALNMLKSGILKGDGKHDVETQFREALAKAGVKV